MVWSEASRTISIRSRASLRLVPRNRDGRVTLLARVTFGGWFRRGDFLSGLVADPIGVENSWFIDALVGMGTEVIALRLQQICRQTRRPIAVEVGDRGAECRRGDAKIDGGRD